jgi:hypothetical protein
VQQISPDAIQFHGAPAEAGRAGSQYEWRLEHHLTFEALVSSNGTGYVCELFISSLYDRSDKDNVQICFGRILKEQCPLACANSSTSPFLRSNAL